MRRFGLNDFLVDCTGRAVDGVYSSVLSTEETELVGEDFMSLLIAQFAEAVQQPDSLSLVPGEIGLRNLELQLQILQRV